MKIADSSNDSNGFLITIATTLYFPDVNDLSDEMMNPLNWFLIPETVICEQRQS